MVKSGKRADKSSGGKRSPSLIDTRKTGAVTSTLAAFWGIGLLVTRELDFVPPETSLTHLNTTRCLSLRLSQLIRAEAYLSHTLV